jgi:hypothetical protein
LDAGGSDHYATSARPAGAGQRGAAGWGIIARIPFGGFMSTIRAGLLAMGVGCAMALSACTFGITQGAQTPQGTYDLPVNYRSAYQSALQQARACLLANDYYKTASVLNDSTRTGVVRVLSPFSDNDFARVDINAIDDQHSRVHIVMWGERIWNANAVVAMRDAIRFGVPSCTSYMPNDQDTPAKSVL